MKEFAPTGSKFFPFRVDPFQNRTDEQKSKQEVTKVVSLVKYDRNLQSISSPFKIKFYSPSQCYTFLLPFEVILFHLDHG